MTFEEFDGLVETVIRKRVVRNGKVVVIKKTNKPGFKIHKGKEVRMAARERLKRRKSQISGARKRKPTMTRANQRRQRSLKKLHH